MVSGLLTSATPSLTTTSMLSVLKRTAFAVIAGPEEDEESASCWEDEPTTLTLSFDALQGLISPFSRVSWSSVAATCTNTVVHAVQKYLLDDVYELVQVMADVEFSSWENCDFSVCETAAEESLNLCSPVVEPSSSSSSQRSNSPVRQVVKRRKSGPELNDVLIIKNENPDIPTIVVTPCPTLPRDRSCLVPYQDVSFGNRLAVPMHPVVNDVFPPLLLKSVPYVERWRFKDGHWWAVLPTLEEQMKRGLFSRPVTRRRRLHQESWIRSLRTRRTMSKQ